MDQTKRWTIWFKFKDSSAIKSTNERLHNFYLLLPIITTLLTDLNLESIPLFLYPLFFWNGVLHKGPEETAYRQVRMEVARAGSNCFNAVPICSPLPYKMFILWQHFRYIVLTTKHHEGFALFPSKSGAPGWNSLDAGPKKDIVKELSEAIKKYNIKFGAYYSLLEWTNELYLRDKQSNFQNISYVDKLIWNDIKQLITDYQPSVLWLDGEWDADYSYWQATKILAWIYNQSLSRNEIVVNDRFGKGLRCFHGDFYNCEDRFNPRKFYYD